MGPGMTDVTLIAGEVEGTFGGLEGSMECSIDVFTRSAAEQFTRSFEVTHPQHLSFIAGARIVEPNVLAPISCRFLQHFGTWSKTPIR